MHVTSQIKNHQKIHQINWNLLKNYINATFNNQAITELH